MIKVLTIYSCQSYQSKIKSQKVELFWVIEVMPMFHLHQKLRFDTMILKETLLLHLELLQFTLSR